MYGRGHGTGERKPKRQKTSRRRLLQDIANSIAQHEKAGNQWSFEQYGIYEDNEKAIILSMMEV